MVFHRIDEAKGWRIIGDRHRLEFVVWHQAATHMGLPEAWLEKNVMTCPAGSRTVKTS